MRSARTRCQWRRVPTAPGCDQERRLKGPGRQSHLQISSWSQNAWKISSHSSIREKRSKSWRSCNPILRKCHATFAWSADSWLLHPTQTHSPGPLFQPLSLSTRGGVLRTSIIHCHTTSLHMLSYIIHAFMLMLIWETYHSLASLHWSTPMEQLAGH